MLIVFCKTVLSNFHFETSSSRMRYPQDRLLNQNRMIISRKLVFDRDVSHVYNSKCSALESKTIKLNSIKNYVWSFRICINENLTKSNRESLNWIFLRICVCILKDRSCFKISKNVKSSIIWKFLVRALYNQEIV